MKRQRGFTLIELSMVLLVVALLLGGLLVPLSAQMDARNTQESLRRLDEVRDALLGYAAAHGRLPCPARGDAGDTGIEYPSGGGVCARPWNGYVPAVTLGLSPTDTQGYLLDGWGNRVRYALTTANANAFSTANGLRSVGLSNLAPDLKICAQGSAITAPGTAAANCVAANRLADDAVAVIYSLGRRGSGSGAGSDESHNPNPNATVAADPAFVGRTEASDFDDLVVWLSANVLYNRMIAAQQLP